MTPVQIKLTVYGVAALILWLLRPQPARTASGDVDLGVQTVDGVYGGDYKIPRPASDNPAVDPRMRELIDQSNLLIAREGT